MVGVLRNLLLLASSFALVSAIVLTKRDSTPPCREVLRLPYDSGGWIPLIDLKTTAPPNAPIKVYTGTAHFPWGLNCQFVAMFGKAPSAKFVQLKQSVTCQGLLVPQLKIVYYNQYYAAPYKEFKIPTQGGKCGNGGAGFQFDPTKFGLVSVYFKKGSDPGGSR